MSLITSILRLSAVTLLKGVVALLYLLLIFGLALPLFMVCCVVAGTLYALASGLVGTFYILTMDTSDRGITTVISGVPGTLYSALLMRLHLTDGRR